MIRTACIESHTRCDLRTTCETTWKEWRQCCRHHHRTDRSDQRGRNEDEGPPANDLCSGGAKCSERSGIPAPADVTTDRLHHHQTGGDCSDQRRDPKCADLEADGSFDTGLQLLVETLDHERAIDDDVGDVGSDAIDVRRVGRDPQRAVAMSDLVGVVVVELARQKDGRFWVVGDVFGATGDATIRARRLSAHDLRRTRRSRNPRSDLTRTNAR